MLFGRNEGGGQRFHGWVQDIIDTDDEGLNALFQQAASQKQAAE